MARTLVAITGASSGIGEAFARRLAPEHDLLLAARRTDRLQQLASELSSRYPTRVAIMTVDLTQNESLEALAQRLEEDDRLALLVNNAGFGTRGLFWEAPFETQDEMHKLHVMAPLRLTHAALRSMVRRDYGGIINVASIASFVRTPGNTSYSSTKSWLAAFSEALFVELKAAGSQVQIQALCPGYTYSEFHQRLNMDQARMGSNRLWLTAEAVVDASLTGLRKNKLFVIPGWRYRAALALFNALPSFARVAIEQNVRRNMPQPRIATRRPDTKLRSAGDE